MSYFRNFLSKFYTELSVLFMRRFVILERFIKVFRRHLNTKIDGYSRGILTPETKSVFRFF